MLAKSQNDVEKGGQTQGAMGRERHRVFVKSGVTAETTEELLKRHFATFGTVTDVYIPRSMPGPTPKGFAYVSFESEDAVQRAVSLLTICLLNC